MNTQTILILLILVVALATLTTMQTGPTLPSDITTQCTTSEDCVPAQCCHPTSAVNKAYAPSCQDVACTLECKPGTLDCGQGSIECISNRCTVVLNNPSQ